MLFISHVTSYHVVSVQLLKKSDSDNYGSDGDDVEDDEAEHTHNEGIELQKHDSKNIFQARGAGVAHRRAVRYDYPPTWLKSNAQLQRNPPLVRMHTMSMHVLDHGYGANALLTVREIDDEKHKGFTLEQQSRAGVLGRIVSGVWVKIAEVTMHGRSSGVAGEITDSPATLVTFLLMLIHNFNMNSSASVDYWLNTLETEIKDIVVSKHSAHLAEVERILKGKAHIAQLTCTSGGWQSDLSCFSLADFNSYLDPFEAIMQGLSAGQEEYADAPPPVPAQGAASAVGSLGAGAGGAAHAAGKYICCSVGAGRCAESFRVVVFTGGLAKHKHRHTSDTEASEALPDNIEKVALTFARIHSFLGADAYREIRANLDGYELLDIKGLVYWKERLRRYAAKVAALKDLISSQLDEKRNFMSFMLTIITTILAPLAILTGYFGMNFGNMKELDPDTYPTTPGVQLMWVICGVCYGALLLVALHFRVLYSAT
jgi:hypothetical protein